MYYRLNQIEEWGGTIANIQQVQHRSELFKKLCVKNNWSILAETPSHAITGFQTRDTNDRFIFQNLISLYDTYIMPGSKPGFYRVSHMGLQSDQELTVLADRIAFLEREYCI